MNWLLNVVLLIWNGSYLCKGEFSDEWAVQILGGDHVAEEVARDNHLTLLRKVFDDVYVFRNKRVVKRSAAPSLDHHQMLLNHPKVLHAEQQLIKRRRRTDLPTVLHTEQQSIKHRRRRDFFTDDPFWSVWGFMLEDKSEEESMNINDPMWAQMWYLNRGSGLDMNVQKAWKEGVTGKGVVVTILDDGIEKDNPDLIKNYDPDASYDINDSDEDPSPRYDYSNSNRHGTRCAGVVAATANNSVCAIGVAYDASIGGIRMLDGDVTDIVEAESLSHNHQYVDIYTSSWGPDDDGQTVEGPGYFTSRALEEGIKRGRGGLGSIYIWASGNGGRASDNCNCDGYSSSIWTISVSAVSESGKIPWYGESCSSTLASTYSSGSPYESQVVSTDLNHGCTSRLTGSSASAPMAAGLCALALEVNKNLSWRDMQHIIVKTSRAENLNDPVITSRAENLNDPHWRTNAVGRNYSHSFGYGLMDGYGMVQLARSWTRVPEQRMCTVTSSQGYKNIPEDEYIIIELNVDDCPEINYLEHVQAQLTINSDHRGSIEVKLISPGGTESWLVTRRGRDRSARGFNLWPFTTVHMWGENPQGTWKLGIRNRRRENSGVVNIFDQFCFNCESPGYAAFESWILILYGTKTNPDICNDLPRIPNGTFKKNITTNVGHIKCDAGYKLYGSGTIICSADGSWGEPLPRCVSTPCPPPNVPPHAILAKRSAWWVGDSAQYSCQTGYKIKGHANITCQIGESDQGRWDHEEPLCEIVKCPSVEPPENGSIISIENKKLKKKRESKDGQQSIISEQESGNYLDENEFINFVTDENFMDNGLSIKESKAMIDAVFGSTIQYRCDPGFVLLGFAKRTCSKNSKWDYPEPVCYEKHCPLVNNITHGNFMYYGSGINSTVKYSCNTGYNLEGSIERICQVNKKWTGKAPMCVLVDCGPPDYHEPAIVEYNGTSIDSYAKYTCPQGYNLKGNAITTCSLDGKWKPEIPVCIKITCPSPIPFENGVMTSSSSDTYHVNSTLFYTCHPYHYLTGEPIRMCQIDGTWTTESPVCERIDVFNIMDYVIG